MKEIYKKAKELSIEIYPYQKNRLKNTEKCHLMPLDKIKKLSKEEMKKYLNALYRIKNENAGGFDGWSGAIEILKKLGAKEKEQKQGHRIFVSISF